MELNICHLYPDLLNVYGDIGNILVLKYRAQQRGIKINVSNVSIKDSFPIDKYDIALFGGGQDYEQAIVSKDMVETKKDDLTEYIEKGKVLLAICGGYQLLGKYYTTPEGEKLDGLNILDIYTEGGDTRFIGNTVIKNEDFNETYVGFENHSGRTYIGNLKPLGKVIAGYGNNGEDHQEGCIYKNTFGTYFHGSLLSKNPELADRLLSTALKNKYGEDIELESLDDNLEFKAKEFIINRESKSQYKEITT
ncbi:type 1 glutamine amidotransferase [Clostridium sporogenes]|uniref:type 1 glutamine amidotransferase n=1 Tax=Clostridium sporogenes TaxID=1509 RepID=UPI0028FF2968|nr:type 1 glutamine amidotransferase [Clostridium botulinum]